MGKYRTKSTYFCPYCGIAGWSTHTQRDDHIRKSHPDKPVIEGTGVIEINERILKNDNSSAKICKQTNYKAKKRK